MWAVSHEYGCILGGEGGWSPGSSGIKRYHHSGVSAQPGLSTKLGRSFFPFAVHIRTDHHLINATPNKTLDHHHAIQIVRFALSYDAGKDKRVIDSHPKI